jgi:choline dehydrogenase-like flavoprotein
MLQPERYPDSYPNLKKLDFLEHQAKLMGWENKFYRVPQTTRFAAGPNHTGVYMNASTLTGMDATGINDGSKSTTLVTYLSDAWNWGAELFCECEVRHIEKAPDREGYIVYFAWHGSERDEFKDVFYADLMWVHAKKFVFVGAGSLASTEILLRSRQMGMEISDDVGTEMSGNGDMLAFG